MQALNIAIIGALEAKKQMQFFLLPKGRRRNVLRKLARLVKKYSKQRLKTQTDLDGRAFEKRKRGRGKVLTKLGRYMKDTATANYGKVYFSNPSVGRIAKIHQEGIDQIGSAALLKAQDPQGHEQPATRRQAKKLIEMGYKVKRANGKGYKRASQKHIMSTMTRGQAGAVLRALRIASGERPLTTWAIRMAKRSFLGATETELRQLINDLHDSIMQPLRGAI